MLDVSYLTFFVSETSALMNSLASLHLIWVRFCGCARAKGCQGLPEAAAADIVSFAWAVACVEGLRIVAGIWRIQMHYSCVL